LKRRLSRRSASRNSKIKERAFLASLTDLGLDFVESASSLSDEELERHIGYKLNGLCFIADTTKGLCTMDRGDDVVGSGGKDISDDSIFEVSHSADDLTAEVEELTTALASQDTLIRLASRERKDFKSKYESTLRELESTRASVVVSNETEFDGCALHMSNITTL
jgi:hypothetical protein